MTDENWADTIPDDAECDQCGHVHADHCGACMRCDYCPDFIRPYPPDMSNWPTSRAEAEQP